MSSQITVAVVVRNEEAYIEQCISSLFHQEGAPEFEVLIVDSSSTDATPAICKKLKDRFPNLRYIEIPHRGIGYARMRAVEETKTVFLAFLDGDCKAPTDWLKILYEGYQRHKETNRPLFAVGGSHKAFPDSSSFQKILSLFKSSFFASGSSAYRNVANKDRVVSHIPTANVLYTMDLLQHTMPDPSFQISNEDGDISYRAQKLAYHLVQIEGSFVYHKMQPTFRAWLRSMHAYGYGKMQFILKHHFQSGSLVIFLLPIVCLLATVVLLLCSPLVLEYLALLYALLIFFEILRIGLKEKSLYTLVMLFVLFPITHIFYAIGEIHYILSLPITRNWKT